MADLDVQRKSGAPWLWWIIGLIVLILIIWGISALVGSGPREPAVSPSTSAQPASAPSLAMTAVRGLSIA